MITRRKFFKVFNKLGLGMVFLPQVLFKNGASANPYLEEFNRTKKNTQVKNWLYGSPKRGCSCPNFPFDHLE
ncbi:MAG: hypothetical protein AMJ90_02720 [candidate division Zixibacteria bacterium SM23_73_2]|nr:MAG: hypothetical protein AMJ90_02720 [candidate division Zixibacteria bacterium SM23_73_2]